MSHPFVPDGVKILSVGDLTREVKGILEDGFGTVWVAGQISNFKPAASGHVYFGLKDAEAQLKAVLWRAIAARLRFEPHDGLEVIARGRLDLYLPHGEYKLIVEEMHPKGLGALELAFRQLREKLFNLGYFAPERKKPLPRFPRRVALVTSPTGAAVRDMLEILGRRWPGLDVYICPVRVQGEGASQEIASALAMLNRIHETGSLPFDVLIVGRGGGSMEDLWAFNEECVAHAIFASRIPVVSAVGHEVDVTIADLVSDRRALTPSEAAEIVAPNREDYLDLLRAAEKRLNLLAANRLNRIREKLHDLSERRVFRLPLERIRDQERRLDDWAERLGRALEQRMTAARERLAKEAARLETLSPLNVLARGYSLTRKESDRQVVRNADQVDLGDRLVTQVRHGRITSVVCGKNPEEGNTPLFHQGG